MMNTQYLNYPAIVDSVPTAPTANSSAKPPPIGLVSPLVRSVNSTALAAIYKIAELFCRLVKSPKAERFRKLCAFHWERSDAIDGWRIFGSRRVANSVNIEKTNTLTAPFNVTKVAHWVAKANEKAGPYVRFDMNRFPKEKLLTGNCVGMSLEFISQLLNEMRGGQPCSTAFFKLCQERTEGGSEDTTILTALQNASLITSDGPVADVNQVIDNLNQAMIQTYDLAVLSKAAFDSANRSAFETLDDGAYIFDMYEANVQRTGHWASIYKEGEQFYFYCSAYAGAIIPKNEFASLMQRYLDFQSYNVGFLYKVA